MADQPKPAQTTPAPQAAPAAKPAHTDEIPKTTITLNVTTRDRLRKMGKFGERWDDMINHLMDEYEKMKKQQSGGG
jgi:hypothetical protein